jgi:glutamate synthase domain-containing protein 2
MKHDVPTSKFGITLTNGEAAHGQAEARIADHAPSYAGGCLNSTKVHNNINNIKMSIPNDALQKVILKFSPRWGSEFTHV